MCTRVSDIFESKPSSFGLRGDEKFWQYLQDYYKGNPQLNCYLSDVTVDEITANISHLYNSLFNDDLFTNNMFSFCPILSAGLSDGIVSPLWWNTDGKSVIKRNYYRLVKC